MTLDEIISIARNAGSIDSDEVIETAYAAFSAAERNERMKTFGKDISSLMFEVSAEIPNPFVLLGE